MSRLISSSTARRSAEQAEHPSQRASDRRYHADQDEGWEETEPERNHSSGLDSASLLLDRPAPSTPGIVGKVFERFRQGSAGAQGSLYCAGEAGAGGLFKESRPGIDRIRAQVEPVTDSGQQIAQRTLDRLRDCSDCGLRRSPSSQARGEEVHSQGQLSGYPGTTFPLRGWFKPTQSNGDSEGDDRRQQNAQWKAEKQKHSARCDRRS
jgi:hypothetical protein